MCVYIYIYIHLYRYSCACTYTSHTARVPHPLQNLRPLPFRCLCAMLFPSVCLLSVIFALGSRLWCRTFQAMLRGFRRQLNVWLRARSPGCPTAWLATRLPSRPPGRPAAWLPSQAPGPTHWVPQLLLDVPQLLPDVPRLLHYVPQPPPLCPPPSSLLAGIRVQII